jgi:hypothetical protein
MPILKISKRLVFKTLLEASLVRIQKQVVSLAQDHLAGLSQLRTFFGFFVLIFIVKRCVFTVAL